VTMPWTVAFSRSARDSTIRSSACFSSAMLGGS
jgi:hypothetical protein